jgi:predicted P-loop ATPase
MMKSMLDAARETLALDIYPLPIKAGTKHPPMTGWQNIRITVDDLPEYFSNGNGLGWLLGINPRPIADVDIDSPEALAIAALIQGPTTDRVFGRASARASHRLYEVAEEFESVEFKDPLLKNEKKKAMLIELRGHREQTVVPPTLHNESGEYREWEREGEFGEVTFAELRAWVTKIAAAALLVRYWPRGHDTRHALAGMLARAGWTEEATTEFVVAVVHVAQADSCGDREASADVRNTYAKVEQDNEITGRARLQELLGENGKPIIRTVARWLELRGSGDTGIVAAGKMIRTEGGGKMPLLANAITALQTAAEWQSVLGFNEFTLQVVTRKSPPWPKPMAANWTDIDDIKLAEWLQHSGVLVGKQIAADAAQAVATTNPFHPVKEYLEGLKWDGVERLKIWLCAYLGVDDSAYTCAVGRCWMISAVARIYRPGCKADHTLVLEGPQGLLKSTALRTLAGDEYFTDHLSDLDNKDSRLELHGKWIIELAELASIRRGLVEKVKSFLSATSDYIRPPYGRRPVDLPRSNVFAATINDLTPFSDETGAKRFWPVRCGLIDIDDLKAARDQLWAEAVARYKKNEKWWLDTNELNRLAAEAVEARYESGVWDDTILTWLKNPTQRSEWSEEGKTSIPIRPFNSNRKRVTVTDVLIHAVGKRIEHCTQADRNQAARCLTHANYRVERRKVGDSLLRFYQDPTVPEEQVQKAASKAQKPEQAEFPLPKIEPPPEQ